jgi:ectoine hydroxylase-related dioxygenase (phytanoyl-CoA dioxygenase family)
MSALQSTESGFHKSENVLSYEECDALIRDISRAVIDRGRAGARHLMAVPQVMQLANEPRLMEIAQRELGKKSIPFRATLFEKSGKANWLVVWHQDTALPLRSRFTSAGWGPWSEKAGIIYAHAPAWALSRVVALRIHLDASTNENGPLRIVPDSHNLGVLMDDEIVQAVKERGYVECLVPKGGVLLMRPLSIHSSSKVLTSAERRVLHIEYTDSLILAPGIELAIA